MCSSTPGTVADRSMRETMLIDSYDTAGAEHLLRLGRERYSNRLHADRLLITEAVAAAAFLAGACSLAVFASSSRAWSPPALAVTVAAYLIAGRAQYPVGSAWTAPTQLVFVPMLFVLPTPFVPLIVAGCSVADRLTMAIRGREATRLLARVGDSFYALGPALVLVLGGAQNFSWGNWPLFLFAFAAQVAFDAGGGLARTWFAERVSPSVQLPMTWLYLTDACFSCVGVLIAAAVVPRVGLLVLVLPLIGLHWVLARERQQRLHYSLALNEEHRTSVELQRGLLPRQLPEVPGIALAAHYGAAGPHAEAGGDWYDAFPLPGGRVGLVVGDVTGRGIPAASAMGQLRSVTRAFALADDGSATPSEVLTRLNRYLLALPEPEMFSIIYATIDPSRGKLTWASGGHPPPLLRSARGSARYLEGSGPVIGIADVEYEDLQATVRRSDSLILYSDGLVERRGELLDVGLTRLSSAAARGPAQPSDLCEHVLGEMLPIGQEHHDDVTLLIVTVRDPAALRAGTSDGAFREVHAKMPESATGVQPATA